MSEEKSSSGFGTCKFCRNTLSLDDESNYREVVSWVHGPKLDHPKLREQTGQFAHEACVNNLVNGQSPDQEPLF